MAEEAPQKPIPSSVREEHRATYFDANEVRRALKGIAADLENIRRRTPPDAPSEAFANQMLAYRHIEDASMRLGKVLQALDGGVSVYDKSTTAGAPDESGR